MTTNTKHPHAAGRIKHEIERVRGEIESKMEAYEAGTLNAEESEEVKRLDSELRQLLQDYRDAKQNEERLNAERTQLRGIFSQRPQGGPVVTGDGAGGRKWWEASRGAFDDPGIKMLGPNDRLSDLHEPSRVSFGKLLKAWATGDTDQLSYEEKQLSVGTVGTHVVPEPISAMVIDLARAESRVISAGARTIPMASKTLRIPRLTDDPAPTWKAELATSDQDEPSLDSVVLDAETLRVIVKVSRELFADAEGVAEVVIQSLSEAFAAEVDRVSLYGSGTAPEPEGLYNMTGLQVVTMADPDGAAFSATNAYSKIGATMLAVEAENFGPNALIANPRSWAELSDLQDANNQPLQAPARIAAVPWLSTTRVAIDETFGASTDASHLWAGEWSELLIGMRQQVQIRMLDQLFADEYAIGVEASLRMDVQVAHLEAFAALTGITAA